jgi:carbon monoxide dehydrogenase subunit G
MSSMIKIMGSYRLETSIDKVWPRIFDPQSLMSLIPGCQQLQQVGPDEYQGQILVGVAAVRGTYDTQVNVSQRDPPHSCRFEGEVSGSTGIIKGEASFILKEVDKHNSLIEYEAKAMVTGALARLSPRFLEGVAKTLINLGLANLNRQLQAQPVANTRDQIEN